MRKATGICCVSGCGSSKVVSRQMCKRHYAMWWKRGNTEQINASPGTGRSHRYKTKFLRVNGRFCREHTFIAEQALGKRLPPGALVHHVDGDELNNDPANLVICPDRGYHNLLHKRTRELFPIDDEPEFWNKEEQVAWL